MCFYLGFYFFIDKNVRTIFIFLFWIHICVYRFRREGRGNVNSCCHLKILLYRIQIKIYQDRWIKVVQMWTAQINIPGTFGTTGLPLAVLQLRLPHISLSNVKISKTCLNNSLIIYIFFNLWCWSKAKLAFKHIKRLFPGIFSAITKTMMVVTPSHNRSYLN